MNSGANACLEVTTAPLAGFIGELRPTWQRDALCRSHPDIGWFPEKGQPGSVVAAKAVCRRCAVQAECLAYALANRIDHGVWGGRTARERRRILRQVTLEGWAPVD